MQRRANNRTGAVGPVVSGLGSFFYCRSQDENTEGNGDAGSAAPENPVVCEVEDSFTCSVALHDPAGFATMVAVSVSGAVVPPVLLTIPARPGEWQDSLFPLVCSEIHTSHHFVLAASEKVGIYKLHSFSKLYFHQRLCDSKCFCIVHVHV